MTIIIPQEEPQTVNPPRIQSQADETTFGGGPGVQAINEQVQKIAGDTNEIAEFGKLEKIRNDQVAVQSATAQLDALHANLINDPESGLPSYKGANAMAGHDKVMAEYQKQANEIANGLQPDQQGAFNKFAINGAKALNEHAMGYVRGQMEQHDTNTFNAAVANKIQLASNNYGNPDSLATFKDQLDKLAGARAARVGMNPNDPNDEEYKNFKRNIDTNFHESVLSQMVNDPKFMPQAKQYFADNKDSMDVASQDRVRDLFDKVPKQKEETAKQQQADFYKGNMKTAMLDMFDGKLTLSEAQRRFRNGDLDKADYDTLETRLNKPDANIMRSFEQSDPKTFNTIRQAQLNGTKDPGEIQRMIAQGAASKDITPDDGKYLMGLNSEKPPTSRDKDIDAAAKTVKDFADRHLAETNFFGIQTDASKQKASQESEALVQDFYNRVDKAKAQGEDITDISQQVMKTAATKRYPGLGKLEKMPDVVIDVKGNITRLLNPDQRSGLKPKYKITPTEASDRDSKEEK